MTMINQKGQTLIMLLVFMVIAVIVTSAATIVILSNTNATSKFEQGLMAYKIAESGAENAVLKILRDPNYTGETMTVDGGTATATVSGSTTKTITSVGTLDLFQRTIQVTASYVSNKLTITSWKEI